MTNINTLNKDEVISHTAEILDTQNDQIAELQLQRIYLACTCLVLLSALFL
ncbi:hypothetical protein [Synechococcus sp. MU1643]|uniref:hypothetical protein n=1 Tax=Synechococcus sp. MU1643 TaxID=2508349 RepID=UPI001CF8C2CB|nr:hypothetical protein [Synechococcus sp. MU1643]